MEGWFCCDLSRSRTSDLFHAGIGIGISKELGCEVYAGLVLDGHSDSGLTRGFKVCAS